MCALPTGPTPEFRTFALKRVVLKEVNGQSRGADENGKQNAFCAFPGYLSRGRGKGLRGGDVSEGEVVDKVLGARGRSPGDMGRVHRETETRGWWPHRGPRDTTLSTPSLENVRYLPEGSRASGCENRKTRFTLL